MKNDKDISVSRAVGRFFGHIWGAATRPVSADEPGSRTEVVAHEVEEVETEFEHKSEHKKVILRRTTIDEVEIREDS